MYNKNMNKTFLGLSVKENILLFVVIVILGWAVFDVVGKTDENKTQETVVEETTTIETSVLEQVAQEDYDAYKAYQLAHPK